MKLDVDLTDLFKAVAQMGAELNSDSILDHVITAIDPIDVALSNANIEVDLSEIEVDHAGLLNYQGRQILLYIEDHGTNVLQTIEDGSRGKKYHVAECKTLQEMRRKGRFERYVVTRKLDGMFKISGQDIMDRTTPVEGEAELCVCKNCLNHLNFKGYSRGGHKGNIFRAFSIREFFTKYSSFFQHLPIAEPKTREYGYTEDWPIVSGNYKASKKFCCESCGVNLSDAKELLHTHHRNGVKSDNKLSNLQALCADCHRKQPLHERMFVKHADMATINRLRRAQALVGASNGWKEVLEYADPSIEGLILVCQQERTAIPEVGYEVCDSHGTIVSELEVAWPKRRIGVAVDGSQAKAAQECGWTIWPIADVINETFRFVASIR